jgi:hypothetical protein
VYPAPLLVEGRWYAKGCTVRQASTVISPFYVYRGAALALDACSVEDTDSSLSSNCAPNPNRNPEDLSKECEFEDGTPATGEIPLSLEVAEYCLTGSMTPSEV